MASQGARVIFHVDMNSFYASVEVAHHPELRGKPLAIAGRAEERRGIVVTSSYEARAKGVKTTMPVWEAKRHCPRLIVKNPNFPLYRETSRRIFELLRSYTPLVQKVSIDEGYMDVTEHTGDIHPLKLAETIQQRIKDEILIPCSIGIAPNKYLAKMASDMKKPMGITVLRKRDLPEMLWPLHIGEMHGVGPKSEQKFKQRKIETIGDLAKEAPGKLKEWFGVHGERLHERANGIDQRPVDPEAEHEFKSIGQSTTLPEDISDYETLYETLHGLAERVESRLKAKRVCAYQVQLMIRYSDWRNITRVTRLNQPIMTTDELFTKAKSLLDAHWSGEPVRLLGITAGLLEDTEHATKQLDLFTYEQDARREPLTKAIDNMRKKYGSQALNFGANNNRNSKSEK